MYLYLYCLYQTQLGNIWFLVKHTQCDTLSNGNRQIYNHWSWPPWVRALLKICMNICAYKKATRLLRFICRLLGDNGHFMMPCSWTKFVSIDMCMNCEYLNISWTCCSFFNNKFQELKSNTSCVETFSTVILSTNILPL